VDALAAVASRRAYENLEAGQAEVNLRDAAAQMRLAGQIEHDDALIEQDRGPRPRLRSSGTGLETVKAMIVHWMIDVDVNVN
jgi:hypothetical protein